MALPGTDEIIDDLDFFDDWEDRYNYIIDLGKALPSFDEALKTPERLIKGCQSSVWIEVLEPDSAHEPLKFLVESDAIIVRGLLALVMAAFNGKTAADILAFDIDAYFSALDLEQHLSPTRGNGLKSIVARIQAIAQARIA
ncbi:SufE family protein [Marinomonas agarivorans]|nr:SufE family protein [Marinomonas agarivorans]